MVEYESYACYLNDNEELKKSTSGAVFWKLATTCILDGGVVFGAVLDEDMQVRHVKAQTNDSLEKMRKSKYVQSRIGNTYQDALECLKQGRRVLFSGTPCQIAGLKSYLGSDYEELLCVEVICQGVPSQKLFNAYMENLEKDGKIETYDFRDGSNGWETMTISYRQNKIQSVIPAREDEFFYGFERKYSLRRSCYHCRFREENSKADITIGDFWNIKEEHKNFYNRDGVSAVILRTQKGKQAFDGVKACFVIERSSFKQIAHANPALINTVGGVLIRNAFFEKVKEGERNLLKVYEEIEQLKLNKKIFIIGSYSNRLCFQKLKLQYPDIQLRWHITNSSICSMMSEPMKMDIGTEIKCNNAYRTQSVLDDIEKNLESKLSQLDDNSWLLIDFLEERNPLYTYGENNYLTDSEAFRETGFSIESERINCYDLPIDLWEEKCKLFIELIKKYSLENKVILNCLFLCEEYMQDGQKILFEQSEEIKKINKRLEHYYSFFMEHMNNVNVIQIDDNETNYCTELFTYGCEPYYYNMERYDQVRSCIEKIIVL